MLQPAQGVPPEGGLPLACQAGRAVSGWGLESCQGPGLGLNHGCPTQAMSRPHGMQGSLTGPSASAWGVPQPQDCPEPACLPQIV